MKKSTVLLLVVVYVLSFLIIGLLGQAVRAYNPTIYPESITLVEPDNIAEVHKDVKDHDTGEIMYDYYFIIRTYKEGMSVRIKAEVKPDNSSFPNVDFFKDGSDETYNLNTHQIDDAIENNYAVITLNAEPDPIITARFHVQTENPGTKISLKVGVTFMNIQSFLSFIL